MNLQMLKDIAKELDGLEIDDATIIESNIAKLLINAGLMKIEQINVDGILWKEYKTT